MIETNNKLTGGCVCRLECEPELQPDKSESEEDCARPVDVSGFLSDPRSKTNGNQEQNWNRSLQGREQSPLLVSGKNPVTVTLCWILMPGARAVIV